METFRLAKTLYINDLSGEGARKWGGRWNSVGVPVLYTGSSMALCILEFFVNLQPKFSPPKDSCSLAKIYIPDNSFTEILLEDLPKNWKDSAALKILFEITEKWIRENKYLVMKAPSAIVEQECNLLINPSHHLFKEVRILDIKPYNFDERMFITN